MKEVLITWLFQKRMANFENKKKKQPLSLSFPISKRITTTKAQNYWAIFEDKQYLA